MITHGRTGKVNVFSPRSRRTRPSRGNREPVQRLFETFELRDRYAKAVVFRDQRENIVQILTG